MTDGSARNARGATPAQQRFELFIDAARELRCPMNVEALEQVVGDIASRSVAPTPDEPQAETNGMRDQEIASGDLVGGRGCMPTGA
jgi:hypothetical protein